MHNWVESEINGTDHLTYIACPYLLRAVCVTAGRTRLDFMKICGRNPLPLVWERVRFIFFMPNKLYLLGTERDAVFHNGDYHHK